MKSFGLYTESWLLYVALGLLLLFLLDLKTRYWKFEFRAGLLSLIAAAAFTPQAVTNSDSYAPLLLNSLLNAEIQGVDSIYQGLLTLSIVWVIIFTMALSVRHFILANRKVEKIDTEMDNKTNTTQTNNT